jgi:hypothetical protein
MCGKYYFFIQLKKLFTAANRDKESMVIKYAVGEKEVILQRRAKDETEKRLKAANREREDLANKIRTLTAEKSRALQLADSRLQDVNVVKKDGDRWREEVKVQEAKACVAGSRLKAEADAHR